jgi:phage virion morphogenesis protein
MAGITYELDSHELDQALDALEAMAANSQPLLLEVGEIVLSQAQDSFENQAAPGGTPWIPSQRVLDEGGQTLVDSGQLLASLGMEVLPDAVMVGSNKVYAAIHQGGGKAGRGGSVELSARPYLPDDETVDLAAIREACDAFVAEALGR